MSDDDTDTTRTDILEQIDAVLKKIVSVLGAAADNSGPIASDALDITTKSGIGAFGTAAAGAITAIIAAAKGQNNTVVVAGFAFAAVAILALAIIVVSDHRTRASAYVALESSLPALLAASAPLTPSVAAASPAKPAPVTYVLPVHDQTRVKLATTGDELFDVLAIRVDVDPSTAWTESSNPAPWYLTGQIGGSPPQWRQGEIGSLAGPPRTAQ